MGVTQKLETVQFSFNSEDTKLKALDWISWQSGPSCSKLTTSLVNDSLKFTSSDTQIY